MAFDDDSNGYIDYDEFLRQIFPEEYVKDAGRMSSSFGKSQNVASLTVVWQLLDIVGRESEDAIHFSGMKP